MWRRSPSNSASTCSTADGSTRDRLAANTALLRLGRIPDAKPGRIQNGSGGFLETACTRHLAPCHRPDVGAELSLKNLSGRVGRAPFPRSQPPTESLGRRRQPDTRKAVARDGAFQIGAAFRVVMNRRDDHARPDTGELPGTIRQFRIDLLGNLRPVGIVWKARIP